MLKFLLRGKKLLLSVEVNHRFIQAFIAHFVAFPHRPNAAYLPADIEVLACGAEGSGLSSYWQVKLAARKQEINAKFAFG